MIKRRCVNPNSRDAFEKCSPGDESDSFRDPCGGTCGDSCAFSVCVLVVSSCWPFATDVLVSFPMVCLVMMSSVFSSVNLLNRSPFISLSLESDVRSFLNVKEA